MCGITGWIDFERDLRRERGTLEAMTRTMACRGPDDEGHYVVEHAALGHRRLSVIDLDGGDQPKAIDQATGRAADARAGQGDLAIVYSGETYDFREHRDALLAAGVELVSRSDTEVVLHEHHRHGPDAVAGLNGMFAYAVWDDRAQRLHLVRDRLGVKPLYYYPTPTGVLFGSEPKAVLAHPEVRAVVDEDGLRQVFSFAAEPGATPYAGLREVVPGHVVTVDRDGVHDHTYWELTSSPHTDDRDTTVATVRDLLLDTVGRQLVADVPLCTLLSGGLDSSALTAMAARGLAEQGRGAVRTFAVDFAGHEERFVADELRPTPDGPYVADVARHVASEHTDIVLDNAALLDPETRARVLRARDLPGLGEMDTSLLLLFAAVREHTTVALSGESADEVFGGYRDFHDPAAVGADTFPWLAGMARSHLSTPLLAPRVAKALDVGEHTAAQYADALAAVPRLDGETGHAARMREVSYLYLTRFLPTLLDRKDRMSMAVGLEVRVPFCDHRLVQYVFNTPWELKTFDGREKSLLRAAAADLLPDSVVQRVKSPYPSTQDPGYVAATAAELRRRMTGEVDSALPDLADGTAVRALVDDPRVADQNLVDRLLGVDDWIRAYDVELAV